MSDGDTDGAGDTVPARRPPPVSGAREALLWGVVGGFVFLVLHQAYLLAGGRFVGFVPVVLAALLVGAVVAGVARWLALRATRNGQD